MSKVVDVSGVNEVVRDIRSGRPPMEAMKRERVREVKAEIEDSVASRRTAWEAIGLPTRAAEVASYGELGFTDEAIAQLTDLSEETVAEYRRQVDERYEQAARLVARIESTEATGDRWNCRFCGRDTPRSAAAIEYDVEADAVEYRCQACGERQRR